MEEQLHDRPSHDPRNAGEGEEGEKKSVLKKVKDKARKIKDTIKKHGHGQSHGHDHEGYEEDEEENVDEGIASAPRVVGAPIHESTVIRSRTLPKESPEKSTDRTDDQNEEEARPPVGLEEDPHSPKKFPEEIPPSNYQSKVTDPTGQGGKEADVAPLVHQFKSESEQTEKTGGTPENPELNPAGQDQDTIAGKISSATSAIASKLGYGGKLAPVYDKVVDAGTAAMSKVQGSVAADRGAVPLREYLADKFRPGDEDKALSEAITGAFNKKKEAMAKTGKDDQPLMGKVTESEEVAARLGTAAENRREGEDAFAAGAESSGQGATERIKNAVSSWLGKGTGMQTAQDSVGRSYVNDSSASRAGQGQESGK